MKLIHMFLVTQFITLFEIFCISHKLNSSPCLFKERSFQRLPVLQFWFSPLLNCCVWRHQFACTQTSFFSLFSPHLCHMFWSAWKNIHNCPTLLVLIYHEHIDAKNRAWKNCPLKPGKMVNVKIKKKNSTSPKYNCYWIIFLKRAHVMSKGKVHVNLNEISTLALPVYSSTPGCLISFPSALSFSMGSCEA